MYGRGQQSGMQFGPPFTPPIIKKLMLACLAVFIGQALFPAIVPYFVVRPDRVFQHGWLWQPFTYMWLHGDLIHIALNMFMLWMFGSPLTMAWGPKRFLRYYLICGVGAGLLIALIPLFLVGIGVSPAARLEIPTLGASGAVYGVVLAYSLLWPERTLMLIFPPVAFRAIWLIPLMVGMSVLFGPPNISHLGHLGGVLVGWLVLRRQGTTGKLFTLGQLKYRWRRYRMKQKLRAVQYEDFETQRRRNEDDRRYH